MNKNGDVRLKYFFLKTAQSASVGKSGFMEVKSIIFDHSFISHMVRFYFLLFLLLLMEGVAVAQTYSPITITGFNSDLFAESAPNSLATTSMSTDLTDHVMYTAGFATGAGLPAGVVNSGTVVSGTRTYQMAPYSLQNALYVDVGATQSLTLFSTGSYSKISFMGFSAEGNSTLNIQLTFTDGTTTNCGNFTLPDWFDGANSLYCCFSRCVRTTNAPYNIDGLPSNPRFYPLDISLSCNDQKKNLQTITVKNLNGTTGFTNAFLLALSGVPFSQNIFAFATDVTCSGGSNGSINLFASGTATPYTYSWNTIPVQTTANATNLSAGTYICKTTDVNGCITYDTVTVAELAPLPVSAIANPTVICAGNTAQLTASGLSSFTWMPGGQTTNPVTVAPATTTNYTVSGTDGYGCSRQAFVTLSVNQLPVVIINPNPAAICSGGSVVLQAGGASTYTWSPATGLSNSTIFNPSASPTITTVYTVTGTATNNCSNSTTVEVTVNPDPVVVVIADPPVICQGETTTLTLTGLTSFTWSPGGQSISPISVSPLTTTIYSVSGTGPNGCSGQSTVTITVDPLPSISATPFAAAVCSGDSILLTASGGTSYSWLPATGLSDPAISNPMASPPATTTYTVTGFNASGCGAIATSVVTLYATPSVIAAAFPPGICAGNSTQLSVSGLTSFTWNPGGQTVSPITVTPLSSTTYTVTGIDANGCDGTGLAVVIVDPLPVVIASSIDTLICKGTAAVLNVSGNASQYTWSPGATTGNSITVTPNDTTQYIVTGMLGNCTAADTLDITVVPAPTVAFIPIFAEGCDPLLVSFSDESDNGIAWSWLFGDGGTASVQHPDHLFHAGIWSITETVSNSLGCSTTVVLQDIIHVYSHPVADFTVDPALNQPVELMDAVFQFKNQTTGATSYEWDFDDSTFSTDEDPLHTYNAPGEYTVTLIVTGPGDCSDSISKAYINVIPATIGFVPTAFSPNGDGINDVFIPANTNLESIDMKIFNRWGKVVYHGTDPLSGWNGMVAGIPGEMGVYAYSINLRFMNGKEEVLKGNLTLVR
ncbi:MAG: PKD domain-containing protein [Chitinophagales bacterium]